MAVDFHDRVLTRLPVAVLSPDEGTSQKFIQNIFPTNGHMVNSASLWVLQDAKFPYHPGMGQPKFTRQNSDSAMSVDSGFQLDLQDPPIQCSSGVDYQEPEMKRLKSMSEETTWTSQLPSCSTSQNDTGTVHLCVFGIPFNTPIASVLGACLLNNACVVVVVINIDETLDEDLFTKMMTSTISKDNQCTVIFVGTSGSGRENQSQADQLKKLKYSVEKIQMNCNEIISRIEIDENMFFISEKFQDQIYGLRSKLVELNQRNIASKHTGEGGHDTMGLDEMVAVDETLVSDRPKIYDAVRAYGDMSRKYKNRNKIKISEIPTAFITMLEKLNLIMKVNKDTFAMPLQCEGHGQVFSVPPPSTEFCSTSVLRFTIDDIFIPEVLMTRVVASLLQSGWIPAEQGTKLKLFRTEAVFKYNDEEKKQHHISLKVDSKHFYVMILVYGKTKKVDSSLCDKVRRVIEETLRNKCGLGHSSDIITCQIECIQKDRVLTGEYGWLEVEELKENKDGSNFQCYSHDQPHPHAVQPREILEQWFPYEVLCNNRASPSPAVLSPKQVSSQPIRDDQLPGIASCIGEGFMLFCISEGITDVQVERIDRDYKMFVEKIHALLKLWKKLDKPDRTLANLKEKIKENGNVSVDWDRFNNIVDGHT